ncbi:MAG: hypothetical protein ACKVUS_05270 [Saprospiraceae bacterium]
MKRKHTFKSLLITASLLSLFAFAFVNLHANSALKGSVSKIERTQHEVESEEAGETREIPVPDVTVLGRLWEIAQRLLDRAN